MNRKYIYACLIVMLSVCLLSIGMWNRHHSHINGHWEQYCLTEYQFKDVGTQSFFSNWIHSLSSKEDFDLCFQPFTDYVWDATGKDVIDSFNIRLHTHSYQNNYLRPENFASHIKGCCCIGSHILYLYDAETVRRFFVQKNKVKKIRRYICDEHGFLEWRDEDVWVALLDGDLRIVTTETGQFYRNDFLFYDTLDPCNYFQYIKPVNPDTFCVRDNGPFLIASNREELTREQTTENIRLFFQQRLPYEVIEAMPAASYISVICYVDTMGKATYKNGSSIEVREYVDRICNVLPVFIPAMECGIPVNSVAVFKFYPRDLIE